LGARSKWQRKTRSSKEALRAIAPAKKVLARLTFKERIGKGGLGVGGHADPGIETGFEGEETGETFRYYPRVYHEPPASGGKNKRNSRGGNCRKWKPAEGQYNQGGRSRCLASDRGGKKPHKKMPKEQKKKRRASSRGVPGDKAAWTDPKRIRWGVSLRAGSIGGGGVKVREGQNETRDVGKGGREKVKAISSLQPAKRRLLSSGQGKGARGVGQRRPKGEANEVQVKKSFGEEKSERG